MSKPAAGNAPGTESVEHLEDVGVTETLPAERPEQAITAESLGLELPEGGEETVHVLLLEVAKARDDATSYLDDLKRVAADFDNYRKRSIRDQASTHERAAERIVHGLFPTLDSLDAALANEAKTEIEQALHSGMANTRDQLLKALEAEGLSLIPTVGEEFDPEVHEPVGAPAGTGRLVVSEELRRGYRFNGKVVRAALVMLEIQA